jgi:hypothetical protein
LGFSVLGDSILLLAVAAEFFNDGSMSVLWRAMMMLLARKLWPSRNRRRGIAWLLVIVVLVVNLNVASRSLAQQADETTGGQRWAVIFVGLPGDDAHADLFRETADAWQTWLTESLKIPNEQVLRLPRRTQENEAAAPALTAETIRSTVADLNQKLKPNDSLWIFTLGHGNYDGKQAWFHLAGKDPSAEDFGRWFSEVRCREQVMWLTQSNSGWFVKPLSRPGRIVIAATAADDESNETEFPHALATVLQSPTTKLDTNQDEKVSVAELFTAVVGEVARRFQSDKRLPTEHAQLDDNGDGLGTEDLEPATKTIPTAKLDGAVAKTVFISGKK